jgi:hypothetical protein
LHWFKKRVSLVLLVGLVLLVEEGFHWSDWLDWFYGLAGYGARRHPVGIEAPPRENPPGPLCERGRKGGAAFISSFAKGGEREALLSSPSLLKGEKGRRCFYLRLG